MSTKKLLLLSILHIFLLSPLTASNLWGQSGDLGNVIIKEVSSGIELYREGVPIPIYDWGTTLRLSDEIRTDSFGTGVIRFLQPLSANEISVSTSSSVQFTSIQEKSGESIYTLSLESGKIRVHMTPEVSRSIQIKAGSGQIISRSGVYGVEQFDDLTLIVIADGTIRIYDRSTNKYTSVSSEHAVYIDQNSGTVTSYEVPQHLIDQFLHASESGTATAFEIAALRWGDEPLPVELEEMIIESQTIDTDPLTENKPEDLLSEIEVVEVAGLGDSIPEKQLMETDLPTQPSDRVKIEEEQSDIDNGLEKESMDDGIAETGEQNGSEKTEQLSSPVKEETESENKEHIQTSDQADAKQEHSAKEHSESDLGDEVKIKEETWIDLLVEKKWHVATTSSMVVFAYLAAKDATSYNALATRNDTLKIDYANAASSAEQDTIQAEFDLNKSKMTAYKTSTDVFNVLSAVALCFEGYLLYKEFFSSDGNVVNARKKNSPPFLFPDDITAQFGDSRSGKTIGLSAYWYW